MLSITKTYGQRILATKSYQKQTFFFFEYQVSNIIDFPRRKGSTRKQQDVMMHDLQVFPKLKDKAQSMR